MVIRYKFTSEYCCSFFFFFFLVEGFGCSGDSSEIIRTYTVGENIIITIKMRNNFYYPLKMVIFPIFRFCMSFEDWYMLSFLYCFPYSYHSSNYCDSNSFRSFTLLKALAKSNGNLFTIDFKS